MFYVTEISQNVGIILDNNTVVKVRSFELKMKQKVNFKKGKRKLTMDVSSAHLENN